MSDRVSDSEVDAAERAAVQEGDQSDDVLSGVAVLGYN